MNPAIKAYIDIDGVLLRNGKNGPELIPRFRRIIRYLLNNFDCYWLTTHVNSDTGSTGAAIKLAKYLNQDHISPRLLDGIKPTSWRTLKTEAIDFEQRFIWLDDTLFSAERKILDDRACLASFIRVDWKKRSSRLTVRRLKKVRRRFCVPK